MAKSKQTETKATTTTAKEAVTAAAKAVAAKKEDVKAAVTAKKDAAETAVKKEEAKPEAKNAVAKKKPGRKPGTKNTCLHLFTEEMTRESNNYTDFIGENRKGFHDDFWIYHYDADEVVEWEVIENAFSNGVPEKKLEFLINFNNKIQKNRFVHK